MNEEKGRPEKKAVNIFWFRRDLRLDDNTGLNAALRGGLPVLPVFIFDRNILDELEEKKDSRVDFIHQALEEMQATLSETGSTLDVRHGFPVDVFTQLTREYQVSEVFTNHDYEPYARERDKEVKDFLQSCGIGFQSYKDQVIFEKDEVVKDDGDPYTVFTPYSKKWKSRVKDSTFNGYKTEKLIGNFFQQPKKEIPSLATMGFKSSGNSFPEKQFNEELIRQYDKLRDIPSAEGTTRLGVHLRFGTVSIRKLASIARNLNEVFLNELIWRDFYKAILWHFPQVVSQSFKPEYDAIRWRNNEKEFQAWCEGKTGYPIVDAGMRQLNETGYMHNRLRMVTASFLTKHLLVDWRWGEAYFAKKLLDYDLAANNGGWQWAAGTGCDAAPYFRIFNPYLQAKRFDPDLLFIRKWVPELEEMSYPAPIVEHKAARERCLAAYSAALKK